MKNRLWSFQVSYSWVLSYRNGLCRLVKGFSSNHPQYLSISLLSGAFLPLSQTWKTLHYRRVRRSNLLQVLFSVSVRSGCNEKLWEGSICSQTYSTRNSALSISWFSWGAFRTGSLFWSKKMERSLFAPPFLILPNQTPSRFPNAHYYPHGTIAVAIFNRKAIDGGFSMF